MFAAREIEERFLHCVSRRFAQNQKRGTLLGMTAWECEAES
jgi:hypothetical protein